MEPPSTALSEPTGIPSSTLYYNFTGKDEILAFLLQDWLERTSADFEAAIAGDGLAADPLAAVVTAQLNAMANDPQPAKCCSQNLDASTVSPHIADAVQSALHRPVAKLVADGAAQDCFRKVDIERATSVLYGVP